MDSIQQHLTHFQVRLRDKIRQVTSPADSSSVSSEMVNCTSDLVEVITGMGEAAYERVKDSPKGIEDELMLSYLVNFYWSPLAKNFLLLWRDSIFELERAMLHLQEGSLTEAGEKEFVGRVVSQLQESSESLADAVEKRHSELQDRRGLGRRNIGNWRIQRNPWPMYKDQFAKIPDQCQRIQDELQGLEDINRLFGDIRALTRRLMEDTMGHCHRIHDLVRKAHHNTRELLADGEKSLGKIAARLEDLDQELEIPQLLDAYTDFLDELVKGVPEKHTLPVGLSGGMVVEREVAFHKRVQLWLKSELLPLVYEVWELTEAIRNESKMTFVNQRNYAILQANEVRDGKKVAFDPEGFAQLPEELIRRISIYKDSLADLIGQIEERLVHQFRMTSLFEDVDPFLPVTLQSTIDQLRLNQNEILAWGQKLVRKQVGKVRQLIRSVEKEEALSPSEKIVRYLQEREADPTNSQYASIFLTRGFVSTSFVVGRKYELDHMENLVRNWKMGFRGSVLLSGSRFSGKTLFGEMVASRFFEHNTIRLVPGQRFTIQGRKFEASHDLGAALELIRKYSLNSHYLIWIDDLESWWTEEHNLFQHAEALKQFMDHQAMRSFVMVSLGNAVNWRLSRLPDWSPSFQAEINLDRMSSEEIREAILIRHSATHQKLVNEKGEELNPQEFRRLTNRIAQATAGNIGEALNRWSFATRKRGEDEVINAFRNNYSLPEFQSPDIAILLSSIMMQRRTTEFRLRKIFGPSFPMRYAPLVRRLFGTGVLTRGLDGWLEVNPVLVHDLGLALGAQDYLKYVR